MLGPTTKLDPPKTVSGSLCGHWSGRDEQGCELVHHRVDRDETSGGICALVQRLHQWIRLEKAVHDNRSSGVFGKSAGASTVMSIAGLPRQTRTTIVPQPTWTPFFARRDRPPCPPCAPRFVRPLFWGMAKWVSDKGLCEDEGSAAGSALSFLHDLNPTGGWSGTYRPMPQRVKQGLCPQRRWVM